jgi:hypothetical protein
MSLPIYQRVAVTDAGDVIPGAEYTVINENTGVAAPIYSDRTGATLLTAPYFANSVGVIQFYIAQGTTYRVAASGGVGTYTDRYVYGVAEAVLVNPNGNVDGLTVDGLFNFGSGANTGQLGAEFNGVSVTAAGKWRVRTNGGTTRQTIESNGDVVFYEDTGTTPKFFWDASAESLGIGTSSPSKPLTVYNGSTNRPALIQSGDADSLIEFKDNSTSYAPAIGATGNDMIIQTGVAALERVRIDSSGNVLFGKTSLGTGNVGYEFRAGASAYITSYAVPMTLNRAASSGTILEFRTNNATSGSVYSTTNSVSYNTSSDYRLKEDDAPMTGIIERVKALRPINFAWKSDGSRVDGFFAHELAEVVPEAATGTKDAMRDEEYEVTPAVYKDVTTPAVEAVLDEDGLVITEAVEESTDSVLITEAVMGTRSVPDYQGIDQAKLVPLLTATIQELIARIEALEGK